MVWIAGSVGHHSPPKGADFARGSARRHQRLKTACSSTVLVLVGAGRVEHRQECLADQPMAGLPTAWVLLRVWASEMTEQENI